MINNEFKKIYDKLYVLGSCHIKTERHEELVELLKYYKLFYIKKKDYYLVVTREKYYSKS